MNGFLFFMAPPAWSGNLLGDSRFGLIAQYQFTDLDRIADLSLQTANCSGKGRRHFHGGFVGQDFHQSLTGMDTVPG